MAQKLDFAKDEDEALSRAEIYQKVDPYPTVPRALLSSAEIHDYVRVRESEIVRFLIRREQEVGWLQWALRQQDPGQSGSSPTLKAMAKAKK